MNKEDFYSTTETGEKFGVSRVTVNNWVDDKKIPESAVQMFGTRKMIRKTYVDKLLEDIESGKKTSIP